MTRFFSIVATFVLLLFAGCDGGSNSSKVTKAEYDAVKEGMSYVDVAKVIGTPGEENASGKMDGVPGVMPSITTKMYSWQNSDGSNMNAMFQNDKLINKAQFGLR